MKTFITLLSLGLIINCASAQLKNNEKLFTENDLAKYEYLGIDLSNIYFFVSQNIMLKRLADQRTDEPANARKGKITFENGKAVEYYEIVAGKTFLFESMSDDKKDIFLRVGADQDEVIKFEKSKGTGNDANFYYTFVVGQNKQVNFLGYPWEMVIGQNSRLAFKEKDKSNVDINKTKTKGMKLDGTEKKGIIDKIKGN